MIQKRPLSHPPRFAVEDAREIAIANRHPRLRFDRAAVRRLVTTLDQHQGKIVQKGGAMPTGELSLVFMTDAALAQVHADFLDDPTPTDVITFSGDALLGTAGEICVSADTAASYAEARGHDFSTELSLYIVHGWLHLAEFDDLEPAKKRAMRRAESRAMRVLAQHRALPTFALLKAAKRNFRIKRKRVS